MEITSPIAAKKSSENLGLIHYGPKNDLGAPYKIGNWNRSLYTHAHTYSHKPT